MTAKKRKAADAPSEVRCSQLSPDLHDPHDAETRRSLPRLGYLCVQDGMSDQEADTSILGEGSAVRADAESLVRLYLGCSCEVSEPEECFTRRRCDHLASMHPDQSEDRPLWCASLVQFPPNIHECHFPRMKFSPPYRYSESNLDGMGTGWTWKGKSCVSTKISRIIGAFQRLRIQFDSDHSHHVNRKLMLPPPFISNRNTQSYFHNDA